jgi:Domain of unknown function (DUF6504)
MVRKGASTWRAAQAQGGSECRDSFRLRPAARPHCAAMASEMFVSERLTPTGGAFGLPIVIGEPVLPSAFVWKQQTVTVREVVRQWREHEADRTHGSGELYLRKHWYELRMNDGALWKVYFQRQPGSRRNAKARWWLYTMVAPGSG